MTDEKMNMEIHNNDSSMLINALGNFKVISNNHNLTDEFDDSVKIWELFKYLFTYRGEFVLPEKIIDSIWPDSEYIDPKRALRALIFRLRKILNQKNLYKGQSLIVHSHGCYKLDIKGNCIVDVVEFEKLFHKAYEVSKFDINQSIVLFKKVVYMYKGNYLSESYEQEWIMPARNHYNRIYLQSIYESSELLKEQKRFGEIVEICELALKHELLEEELHLKYIDALASLGEIKNARKHYDYVTEVFNRVLGVNPSRAFKEKNQLIFEDLRKVTSEFSKTSIDAPFKMLSYGPIVCDLNYFIFHHQIENMRTERYGNLAFLGSLTIINTENSIPEKNILSRTMQDLKVILLSNLRIGDVFTQYNDSQFLLSLTVLNIEQANRALERIQKKFFVIGRANCLNVKISVETDLPKKS